MIGLTCLALTCLAMAYGCSYDAPLDPIVAKESFEIVSRLTLPPLPSSILAHFQLTSSPVEPSRHKKMDQATFLAMAEKGIPFIVQDVMDDWPAMDWTCEGLRERLADEKITSFSQVLVENATFGQEALLDERIDVSTQVNDKEHMPSLSSWYYIAVDALDNIESDVARELQKDLRLPYFVEETKGNEAAFLDRLEVFMGVPKSGAAAHTDQMCEFIASGQVRGAKRWRLAMAPDIGKLEELNPGYTYDDLRHQPALHQRLANEQPLFDFVMRRGDMVFFPPGLIHQTRATDDEACSLSFSLQVEDPIPHAYIRAFRERLMGDLDGVGTCFADTWNRVYFGVSDLPLDEDGTMEEFALQIHATIDKNSDGALSHSELVQHYSSQDRDEDLFARRFFIFNDHDRDGAVTRLELVRTMKEFSPTMKRNAIQMAALLADYYAKEEAKNGASDDTHNTEL